MNNNDVITAVGEALFASDKGRKRVVRIMTGPTERTGKTATPIAKRVEVRRAKDKVAKASRKANQKRVKGRR